MMPQPNLKKVDEIHSELNPDLWGKEDSGYVLDSIVEEALLRISDKFIQFLDVKAKPEDIVITGSCANFNYSKEYSDIDLHVIYDFNKIADDVAIVKNLVDSKKTLWNSTRDIRIHNYPVEVYVQDTEEVHESSGIYSILNSEWVIKPDPINVNVDRNKIEEKVEDLRTMINSVVTDNSSEEEFDKLKEKLKRFRKAGLDTGGELSIENLAFKVLRRSGDIDRLYAADIELIDKSLSLENLSKILASNILCEFEHSTII